MRQSGPGADQRNHARDLLYVPPANNPVRHPGNIRKDGRPVHASHRAAKSGPRHQESRVPSLWPTSLPFATHSLAPRTPPPIPGQTSTLSSAVSLEAHMFTPSIGVAIDPDGQASEQLMSASRSKLPIFGRVPLDGLRRPRIALASSHRTEVELTAWMHVHLRVLTIPVDDPDSLDDLETEVLHALDPPLNLAKLATTPVRSG